METFVCLAPALSGVGGLVTYAFEGGLPQLEGAGGLVRSPHASLARPVWLDRRFLKKCAALNRDLQLGFVDSAGEAVPV